MKKLFNKALMYQNYYTGKLPLFLGLGMFLMLSFSEISNEIRMVTYSIDSLSTNKMNVQYFPVYFLSWVILFCIYFAITGLHKKSIMGFLYSGPFTKEEIKINQILFLFISNILICLTYIYVFLCCSYSQREIIPYISNYYQVFIRDTVKLFVCGTAFISYIILIDTLFSNIVVQLIAVNIGPFLGLVPIKFINDIWLYVFHISNLDMSERGFSAVLIQEINNVLNNLYRFVVGYSPNTTIEEIKVIALILVLSAIMFIAAWFFNKSVEINNTNKLFNFKSIQVVTEFIISFIFVLFITSIFIGQTLTNRVLPSTYRGSVVAFVSILVVVVILSYLFRRLIHKTLQKYI